LRPEVEPAIAPVVPNAPDFLAGDARAEWDRLAPELHALGLLRTVDVNCFAAYCMAFARWRSPSSCCATWRNAIR
jgi:P27 family predicted phage terminase small subunit